MKILVFEPMKKPYVKDIKDNIHAMQEIVGGSIEPIYFEPKQDCGCNTCPRHFLHLRQLSK